MTLRPLDVLVAVFTEPSTSRFFVAPRRGETECIGQTFTPLFDLLEEQVFGSSSGTGGGTSSKTRMPLNGDALQLQSEIGFAIKADITRLSPRGVDLTKYPALAGRLTLWHDLFSGSFPGAGEEAAWRETLEGWANAIDNLMDPPKSIQVLAPCPFCKRMRGRTATADFHALVMTYRTERPAETARVTCLACDTVIAVGAVQVRFAAASFKWEGSLILPRAA